MSLYREGATVRSEYDPEQRGTILEVHGITGDFLVDWGDAHRWETIYDIYVSSLDSDNPKAE